MGYTVIPPSSFMFPISYLSIGSMQGSNKTVKSWIIEKFHQTFTTTQKHSCHWQIFENRLKKHENQHFSKNTGKFQISQKNTGEACEKPTLYQKICEKIGILQNTLSGHENVFSLYKFFKNLCPQKVQDQPRRKTQKARLAVMGQI